MLWLSSGALIVGVVGILLAVRANKSASRANTLSEESNKISSEAKDAAVKAAGEASKSAEEARKTRLVSLASSVTIKDIEPQRERWVVDSTRETDEMTHPGVIEPNTTLHLPVNGDVRLLVGVVAILANEGDRTAQVEIAANRVDDITSETNATILDKDNAESWRNLADSVRRDGRISVAPHSERKVLIRSGPVIQEWLDGGSPTPWTTDVSIASHVAVDAAIQRWSLGLSAQLLTRDPLYSGQVRTLSNTLIGAELDPLPYEYP